LRTAALTRSMSASDWGQLLLLGFLWGGSFFFARIAVAEIPPLALVLYRVSIATLVLHLWLRMRGISISPVLARPGPFLCLALLNNVIPFSLIFTGQTEIGAGLASVLYATTPRWTILVANLLTADEKLSTAKLVGLGIAGAGVMIGPSLLLSDFGGPAWAKLAVIGAAVSYALAVVYAKRFRDIKPSVVATGQLTASTILMVPIVFLLYRPRGYRDVQHRHLDGGLCSRSLYNGTRFHSLFQHHRLGRGNERVPRDASGACQCDHAWRGLSRRKAGAVRIRRDGVDPF
jgi:drug/metabolite transporter (DMT)-like permease